MQIQKVIISVDINKWVKVLKTPKTCTIYPHSQSVRTHTSASARVQQVLLPLYQHKFTTCIPEGRQAQSDAAGLTNIKVIFLWV